MAEQHKCVQCGLTAAEVPTMVKLANGSCICGKCIEEVRNFAAEVAESSGAGAAMPAGAATPKSLVSFLDDYVVGQSDAKKTLAIAVYNHYKRLKHQGDVEITKSNILMLGPTGTGKTLLAQSIARMLDVPFTIADATSLTQAGYVGDDVETILQRLLQAADGDVAKAERGIVFIDEIDKLAAAKSGPSITRDVSGEGVQQALLKLIEGSRVSVQATGNRKTPGAQVDYIDTKNILFICAGAFVPLLDSIKKPIASQGMGFCAEEKKAEAREVTPELLFEHGMIPEFVGRLPVIATLEDLDVAALERILVEPKNAVVRQMQSLFAMDGADLRFEDGSIAAIASQAYKLKTGARGARSILEKLLKEALYEVPGSDGAVVTVGADLKVSVRYQEAMAA